MDKRQPETETYKIPIPWRIYTVIGLITLMVVGSMAFILQQTNNLYTAHDPLLVRISDIQLKVTTAHLWFEEFLSGDRVENIETVRALLAYTEESLLALTDKEFHSDEHVRSNVPNNTREDYGRFHLSHASHVLHNIREPLKVVDEKMDEFIDVLEKRYQAMQTSGPGTDIDQHFDLIFVEFLEEMGEIVKKIQDSKVNHLAEFKIIQTSLIIICLALAVFITIILQRFERRRAEDLLDVMRSEESLRESEELFRTAFHTSPDSININRLEDGVYIDVNDSFTSITGYTKEDVVGKSSLEINIWCDLKDREILVNQLKKHGYVNNLEAKFRYKDGRIRNGLISASTIILNDEPHIISISRDVDDWKKAEEALRESEEKFRNLFTCCPLGIFIYKLEHDESLIFQNANKGADNILGVSCHQFVGKRIEEAFPPLADTEIPTRYKEAAAEGKIWETEQIDYSHGKIAGAYKVVAFQTKPNEMAVMFEDITHRKHAEAALRESEARFKDLASFLPLSLFETDDKGNVTFANPFAFESTGYAQEDIDKGLHMLQLIHPEDQDKAIKKSMQVMQGVYMDGSEYLVQRKDGSTFYALINTNPTIKDDKPVGLKGYIFDLTEQKLAEQTLRASEEKLARSKKMESLGLLAGGVAHDLNNVLSGIVSYPELLLIDLPKDSKLRKPIETIQETGHRAAAIVQDLITVARGVAIAKEPLNLNVIIEDHLLSPEFKKLEHFHPTVTFKTNLDTDLLNISGSDAHLRKVVMNLVSNASEAIEGSGNVIISTMNRYADRSIGGYDDVKVGEYAVLSVSDDGPGISPDDLERIFEPFYTKKIMGRSGTGLGLAVVWNVVQDLKGYLDVISDENGTTFELYFPITRDEVLGKDLSIPIKDYKGDGETVLVVDDVESQKEIGCEMLNTLGYKTKAVSSGEEAVEYLKEHTVDLILLDMIMGPGINGRETYERIIKIHPNQKAIIASGFAETDDVKEAQGLGAGQYIKKPLTLEKMGIAVRDELKK